MTEALVKEGKGLSEDISDLVIFDNESFEMAGALLTGVKAYQKRVEALTDPVIDAAKQAWDTAREQKRLLMDPAKAAEATLKSKLAGYEQSIRDREREEQARVIREQQAAQDEQDLGESLSGEPATAPAFVPPATTERPKAAGVSFRTDYSGECTDLSALVKAVADGKAPLELVQINQPALNAYARKLRETMNFPGVKTVSKRTVTSKASN